MDGTQARVLRRTRRGRSRRLLWLALRDGETLVGQPAEARRAVTNPQNTTVCRLNADWPPLPGDSEEVQRDVSITYDTKIIGATRRRVMM